mmetsp:Transcript_9387/g.25523  ORF Transcript_9387/g.25523 Transcript_9387/m.25523 type:complete len:223 (+) Transcript_9387:1065-1733(+)
MSAANSSGLGTSPRMASNVTIILSAFVVVTLCRFSVSERIAASKMRAIGFSSRRLLRMKLCATMVLMEPQGRMSMNKGFSEWQLMDKQWWSMMPTIRCDRSGSLRKASVICFSSLWSTRQILSMAPSAVGSAAPGTSSKNGGVSRPAKVRACLISPFNSRSAIAAWPFQSFAPPMAPATLSRSVFVWPTKRQPSRICSTQTCSMKASACGDATRLRKSSTNF